MTAITDMRKTIFMQGSRFADRSFGERSFQIE